MVEREREREREREDGWRAPFLLLRGARLKIAFRVIVYNTHCACVCRTVEFIIHGEFINYNCVIIITTTRAFAKYEPLLLYITIYTRWKQSFPAGRENSR